MRVLRPFTISALLLTAAPVTADAQYFGRNKVEYANFDFQILSTEHFDVYYYPREERAAQLAAQLAERWYARFSRLLDHEFNRRQPLVLYGSQAEFAQTNVVSGLLSDSIGGVTEGAKRRIAMPFAPTMAETNRVLGHEIVHAFQFDLAGRYGGGLGQPLWFIEGMAEYLARGAADAEATVWLRDAVAQQRLPRRERDAAVRLSPYHYGHAFWAYLAQRFGDDIVEKTLKPAKRGKFKDRMRQATGVDLDVLFSDWRASVMSPDQLRAESANTSTPARRDTDTFGRMQLGPALSPDGRTAVFFSERDRFSLDLFLADVETRRIIRKLATTTATARFDSLQPIRSAGAWSPNGRWFAFPAVRQGQAAILVIDMQRPGHDREIVLKEVGQVLSITWSPDEQAIALSALTGGFSDLYVYDLPSGRLRQLTDDAFADLHPAWSPSGDAIAFATERYSSDLTALRFGRTRLALIDLASGVTRAVALPFDAVVQANPQWSGDGRHLFFVASRNGPGNVFRFDVTAASTHQLTEVDTSVTGVTPTSPAISVATDAAVLAFTVYKHGRHQLQFLAGADAIAGDPITELQQATTTSGVLPHDAGIVATYLADSATGLPDPSTLTQRDYTPRLSLERIGQPYISTGGGAFGNFVRAGGSLLFGDMLGERRFGAAVQIGNRIRDSAFEVRFLNQKHRWNWGAIAELEPTIRRYRRTDEIEHDGQPALFNQIDYLQRMQLRAAGVLAYPFNRGMRFEFTAGLRHAAYHRDLRSQVSSLATGRVLQEDRVESSGGVATTVGEVGGALVGDTTVFGPTGPLLGSRYRFEIAPAIGSLAYARVLADYRRYLMPVRPYSIALRLLHSGRYGRDGDDPRLLSSFLGSRYFVRGHRLDARHCRPDPDRVCGEDLLGNRLLVANVELRFPIWGMFRRQIEYGPLPADAFVFADGGMVWSRHGQAASSRNMLSSIGAGVRLNAGGLPFEIAAVRALDGPSPRWLVDFGFRVGF